MLHAGKVSLKMLMVYVNAMGGKLRFSILMSWFLLVELCRVGATVWLSYWTGIADNPGEHVLQHLFCIVPPFWGCIRGEGSEGWGAVRGEGSEGCQRGEVGGAVRGCKREVSGEGSGWGHCTHPLLGLLGWQS